MRSNWSTGEVAYLMDNYRTSKYKDIGAVLGRTKSSVSWKVSCLGLRKNSVKRWKWTEFEDDFLKENYKSKLRKDIAKILGRTTYSVVERVRKLGIKKYRKWTEKEISYLKKNYTKMTANKIGKEICRKTNEITSKAHVLGIKKFIISEPMLTRLTEIQLSYLAGIIDGEGSILLCKSRHGLRPCISLCMTDKETIQTIVRWLKSSKIHIHECKPQRENQRCKFVFRIEIRRINEVLGLLIALFPYLITKKERAHLLMEFCKSRMQNLFSTNTEREIEIFNLMKKLNKRGV